MYFILNLVILNTNVHFTTLVHVAWIFTGLTAHDRH